MYVNGNGPVFERDPNIRALVQSVQSRLHEIVMDKVGPEPPPADEIRFVSFEEALRELAAVKKS